MVSALHQWLRTCLYVDQKGSAAVLTSVQSAGVGPEMNLRITQKAKEKSSAILQDQVLR